MIISYFSLLQKMMHELLKVKAISNVTYYIGPVNHIKGLL